MGFFYKFLTDDFSTSFAKNYRNLESIQNIAAD